MGVAKSAVSHYLKRGIRTLADMLYGRVPDHAEDAVNNDLDDQLDAPGAIGIEAHAADWLARKQFWTWSVEDQTQLDAWLADLPRMRLPIGVFKVRWPAPSDWRRYAPAGRRDGEDRFWLALPRR